VNKREREREEGEREVRILLAFVMKESGMIEPMKMSEKER